MSRRVKCPDCYTEQAASSYDRHGCWFCTNQEDTKHAEEAFQNFLELNEEDRWRTLWELVGGANK